MKQCRSGYAGEAPEPKQEHELRSWVERWMRLATTQRAEHTITQAAPDERYRLPESLSVLSRDEAALSAIGSANPTLKPSPAPSPPR